jgi:pSer/pThr/pTyr-binding forkhead associated (FHA) protein
MTPRITLTVFHLDCETVTYTFEEQARCVVGRRSRCDIPLPDTYDCNAVSRQHCLFDIEPPLVRVWDLGSLNGTFVNGEKIGQRSNSVPPHLIKPNEFFARELHDGDVVQVGPCTIRVGVCDLTT